MALTITYAQLRRELGRFLAIGETPANWSSADSTRVDDIILRGSRRFYFPTPDLIDDQSLLDHDWSFIQDALSVSIAASTTYFDLPSDFVRLCSRPSIAGNDFPLEPKTEEEIRVLADTNPGQGDPVYYVIERKKPSSESLAYQIGIYPQSTKSVTLAGDYLFDPTVASSSQAPIVPSDHAETYLAAMLSTAEEMLNYESESGVHLERFKKMLTSSIRRDKTIGYV